MKTFLLSFEEMVNVKLDLVPHREAVNGDDNNTKVIAGTKTLTEVRREGVDEDPQARSLVAIPKDQNSESPVFKTGTTTITAVRAEQIDADPKGESLAVIPK
jgi:hypothetical protein